MMQHPNIEKYDTHPRATTRITSFLNYTSRIGSHVVVQANDNKRDRAVFRDSLNDFVDWGRIRKLR